MLEKRKDASERMFINFDYELKKKHALKEEGFSREGFHQFRIRIESENCVGREGMLQKCLSSVSIKN